MNDYPNREEIQGIARAKVLEAAQEWIDGTTRTEGGIITGWVLIVESADTDGTHSITWCAGNGLPAESGGGGLARWRMLGMMEDVRHSISSWMNVWYMRNSDDE